MPAIHDRDVVALAIGGDGVLATPLASNDAVAVAYLIFLGYAARWSELDVLHGVTLASLRAYDNVQVLAIRSLVL